jgi:hypothetical protein
MFIDGFAGGGGKVLKITRQFQAFVLICSGIAGSLPALAAPSSALVVPSHFSSTIGSALLCQDQIDSFFFTDYMNTYFGKPNKVEGGAYWWKVSSNLYGAKLDSIFVSKEDTSSVFIGAIFVDLPAALRQKIQDTTGVTYNATTNPEQWSSPSFSVMLKYNSIETPSKLFCLK